MMSLEDFLLQISDSRKYCVERLIFQRTLLWGSFVLVEITLGDIFLLFYFSKNLITLPDLTTLINNSSITSHLFCKFKFNSATHLLSPISTFLYICSIKFYLTILCFFHVGVRHEFSCSNFHCNLALLAVAFQTPAVVCHLGYIPSPLASYFHNFDVLVKAFIAFFT